MIASIVSASGEGPIAMRPRRCASSAWCAKCACTFGATIRAAGYAGSVMTGGGVRPTSFEAFVAHADRPGDLACRAIQAARDPRAKTVDDGSRANPKGLGGDGRAAAPGH